MTAQILQPPQFSQNSFLSWATRVSRTQISTVNGFSFSKSHSAGDTFTLDGVLRTVQSLGLPRCPFEDLVPSSTVGEGGTFEVAKCTYQGRVVAVKYIKLGDIAESEGFGALSKRLRSVLQEVCIMHHEPLAKHPTILNVLGYGWQHTGSVPLPYLVVEYGESGSLRSWLRSEPRKGVAWLRSKLMLAGDVAAGLMALHQCGIVHGDLKLDNVIVIEGHLDRPAGAIAKIADFGHSVLTFADGKTDLRYYGTNLYNAPEVFTQATAPIEPTQMHKCDVWSYGLLVWEILADGEWYFKYSWRHDPAFARASKSTSTNLALPSTQSPNALGSSWAVVDGDDSHVFGTFDLNHLRDLAKGFVQTSCGADCQFEKSFLRPFFNQTLQMDPNKRPSDLAKLPIMRHWNQNGTARLRSKLALQLKSSELSFDMFRLESAPEIPWSDQKGMLEDIERIANWEQGGTRSSIAAYQTGLCYILGFGTANDIVQAKYYLRKAAETSHPAALLFNDRVCAAMEGPPRGGSKGHTRLLNSFFRESQDGSPNLVEKSYTKLLGQFFQAGSRKLPDLIESVRLLLQTNSETISEVVHTRPLPASEFLATLPSMFRNREQSDIPDLRVCLNKNGVGLTLLETAVISGDIDLVSSIAEKLPLSALNTLGANGEPPLVQACKSGRADIVCALLKSGADPSVCSAGSCTVLHWLFCIEDDLAMVGESLLPWRELLKDAIHVPCRKPYTVHQQWPLELLGTPLAFATIACSHASVEVLLNLGANPMAKVFSDDTEILSDWNALHLAIKHHLPSTCRTMFKRCDSTLRHGSTAEQFSTPLASALAFSSVVERLCVHAQDHISTLEETISCLPPKLLYTMSAEGQTPLMQAIDFEDVAVIQSLLACHPQLAITRLFDPEDNKQYTYPILFACQLAARKDHPNTMRIPQIIASYDSDALNRVDSRGRTCLHMAATGISLTLLDWLFGERASVHSLDHEGRSALFAAENLPVFSKLVEGGSSLHILDRTHASLAHYAVLVNRPEILRELIKRRAPFDTVCPQLGTPLHCAVSKRSRICVNILLEGGCDNSLSDSEGLTPMTIAMKTNAHEIVRELLVQGAPIDATSIMASDGALDYLLDSRNTAAWRAFFDGFSMRMEWLERVAILHYLAWKKDFASLLFLEKIVEEDMPSNALLSLLQCKELPQQDFLSFRLAAGQTPMHTATQFGNLDALRVFRNIVGSHRFRDNELMDDGRSCLHLALESSSPRPGTDQCHCASSNICAVLLNDFVLVLDAEGNPSLQFYDFLWKHDTWKQAEARKDFGALTTTILLCEQRYIKVPDRDNVRLPRSPADLHVLLLEAISRDEMGFIIACLNTRRVQYADMPRLSWLTPTAMLKLYHYAQCYDMHMFSWRFRNVLATLLTNDEAYAQDPLPTDDDETDYVCAGAERRNFAYEWSAVKLGAHYVGSREEGAFSTLRLMIDEFNKEGKAYWRSNEDTMIPVWPLKEPTKLASWLKRVTSPRS